ncbi:MAG: hypothetical protein QXY40_05745 [Candidatus Methanomethylicia archaeon]
MLLNLWRVRLTIIMSFDANATCLGIKYGMVGLPRPCLTASLSVRPD